MARRLGLIGGLLMVALLFGVQSAPSRAAPSYAATLFALTNQDRVHVGLSPLQWNGFLASVAQQRVGAMARSGVFGNVFSPGVGGENVGWQSGITDPVAAAQSINQRYLASGEHRSNILSVRWTALGTAAVFVSIWNGHSDVWLDAEEFGGASTPAAPAPSVTVPGTGGSLP